ncbi:MAG: hypothetical protein ACM37Z_08185, partial [Deltaproteobacteria bacterium]
MVSRQITTGRTALAYGLVLILGLIFGTAAHAAERKDVRVSFEKEQERLDREERGLHKTFEADKKALDERCDREGRALHEKYRHEERRLERELDALHTRCREQRRSLERNFEAKKRSFNDRREVLRREYHQGPAAKSLPPGLE